jgi:hypothetical protein
VSEELARAIASQAPDPQSNPGDRRHEVSSLISPLAIAPDEFAEGEELVDAGAVEVPVGQSAEPDIDRMLSKAKLSELETSGAALYASDSYDAVAPEELGSEWLARATEASANYTGSPIPETPLPEALLEAGMSVISEASINAASAEQLEADAVRELEGTDDDEVDRDR